MIFRQSYKVESEKYIWHLLPEVSLTDITLMSRRINLHPIVAKILIQKKFQKEQILKYFKSNYKDITPPNVFKHMGTAVERISKAIENKEKIVVYGDYDADGVCATAVLQTTLQNLGANSRPFIPNRLTEGYGLSLNSIKKIHLSGTNLIITVDNGIKSFDEIEYANKKGIDVIVTDHHPAHDKIPNAIAILNPHLEDNITPYAGCGVAFQLIRGLEEKYPSVKSEELLDIVSIGTYTDIVPIIDDNRIIVAEGLKKISNENHSGIAALLSSSGRKSNLVSEFDLGFVIGPRLNAAGRKGSANIALELLSVRKDYSAAMVFARELEKLNDWRKVEMEKIEREAKEIIHNLEYIPHGIVLANPDWHLGVLGLGASRLAELFNRPTILLKLESKFAKGSGRSPTKAFNLIGVLDECSDLLKTYGGHSQAVGLTLSVDNIDEFAIKFERASQSMFEDLPKKQIINISSEYIPSYDDFKLMSDIKKLSPFGMQNEKPLFIAKNVVFDDIRIVGKGHLKARMITKKGKIDTIGFNLGQYKEKITNKIVDVVYSLSSNSWNDRTYIQVNIKDMKVNN